MSDLPSSNPRAEKIAGADAQQPVPNEGATLQQNGADTDVTQAGDAVRLTGGGRAHLRPEFLEGYRIIGDAPLGEGGMGVVWKALQTSTKRTVALKIMSAASFGSERARLRFEREVELTARLDHPNIARVYDSGARSGVFFYSMELIDGVPLDKYVQQQRLSRLNILTLMERVCRAVQHAHQKGVIHRDLKPSNILVDKEGQPHLLDFGLAKIREEGQQISLDGEVTGTPAFMSPEQAAGKHDTLDTRSDVYTLGVILFHLLCGKYPHDVSGSVFDVIRRISHDEPRRLKEMQPGADRELEVLLTKTLAREPQRRYGTAGELADDLERYLKHEPLIAQPPTLRYLFGKKVSKYRVPVTIATGVGVLLVMAVAMYIHTIRTAQKNLIAEHKRTLDALHEARDQRDEANRQRALAATQEQEATRQAAIAQAVSQFQGEMLSAADPSRLLGDKVTVLQATQQAIHKLDGGFLSDQPLVEAGVRNTIGQTLSMLGRYDDAEPILRRALEIRRRALPAGHPDIAITLSCLGGVLQQQHKLSDAEAMLREALAIDRGALPEGNPETSLDLSNLASLLGEENQPAEAEALFREALQLYRAHPSGKADIAVCLSNFAVLLQQQNRLSEAEPLLREVMEIDRRVFPPGHPSIVYGLNNLAELLVAENKPVEAEPLLREALDMRRKTLPAGHVEIATSLSNLGAFLYGQNRFAEAESIDREALAIRRTALPPTHPEIARSLNHLAMALCEQKRPAEAEPLIREALEIDRNGLPAGHPDIAQSLDNLASLVEGRGNLTEAESHFREALEIRRKALPAGHPYLAASQNNLAACLQKENKLAEAEPLFRAAIATFRKTRPPEDLATANAIYGLGRALLGLKRYAESEPLLREALAIREKKLGRGSVRTRYVANDLANLLDLTGRGKEAWALHDAYGLGVAATQPATQPAAPDVVQASSPAPAAPIAQSAPPPSPSDPLASARAEAAAGCSLAAARKFAAAFSQDKSLPDNPANPDARFEAGMAAARCSQRIGPDAAGLSEADRAAWRKQALDWFTADVTVRARQIKTGDRSTREAAVAALRRMEREPDLEKLRNDEAILNLTVEEAGGWVGLWNMIQEQRNRAAEKDD